MDILIIAQFTRDLLGKDNNRFTYLCNMLKENTPNNIELITSDFSHSKKKTKNPILSNYEFKITLVHEPGYKKNISLRRFVSHKRFAQNIKKYLEKRNKPDLVYAAIPSLDVAEVAAKYCKKNKVRFIVDIQDLWPEAFKMVFDLPVISNLLFKPMERQADRIYAAADEIVAVSKTYAARGMRANRKCKGAHVVYLGTDKNIYDDYAKEGQAPFNKPENEVWIAYVGSLAASYDLKTVIDAMKRIRTKQTVRIIVMGDGPLRQVFEEYAKDAGIYFEFLGALPYPQMVAQLTMCDIAVNPIRKGSAGSIINKVNDYAMAGLPVINTQECQEYRELLETYKAGINCEVQSASDVATAIEFLLNEPEKRKEMGRNARRLGEEKFDRSLTYQTLVRCIHGAEEI